MSETHDHFNCRSVLTSSGVSQTLDEMDFERGLWSAALNCEVDRVKKLINQGKDVNLPDSSGYLALVSAY